MIDVTREDHIASCNDYLDARTGTYEQRAVRYRHAASLMMLAGLDDSDTVVDVGAGWTEFDYTLRAEFGWKGRYIPIDGGIDGVDLEVWEPPRRADWFIALEILEHIHTPYLLAVAMKEKADKGVMFSTPNPETTDVLAMDDTHVIEVSKRMMERYGFTVTEQTFYGGRFSGGKPDSLFGMWLR